MIKGIYSSASGMQYLRLKQEVTVNNLANVSTTGFKKDGVFKQKLGDVEKLIKMNAADFVNLEEVDAVITNYEQGRFNVTENPFDFAIEGDGFFAVETQEGIRYTRNGNFLLDSENYLTTTHGYRVLDENNETIRFEEGEIFVGDDGSILVDGEIVAALKIADFPSPYNLLKQGDGLFHDISNTSIPAEFGNYKIKQGMLEDSNVNAIEEMAKLINTIRDFDTNQRSIMAQDQTLDRAINEVGRVRR